LLRSSSGQSQRQTRARRRVPEAGL
jgi:hypothetical protein